MVTLYNVISRDWFIARPDGAEDFIPDDLWPSTLEIYKRFNVLIMGRKTYETIQSYSGELVSGLEELEIKKIVITRNREYVVRAGYQVMSSPEEGITLSPSVLISTGPTINNYLLAKGLVHEVILHQVPAIIESGIPVFDGDYRETLLPTSERDLGTAKELIYRIP